VNENSVEQLKRRREPEGEQTKNRTDRATDRKRKKGRRQCEDITAKLEKGEKRKEE